MSEPWPEELVLARDGRSLRVRFDDGRTYEFDAEFLRVESPSAEVKGHGPGQEQLITGKRNIVMNRLEPVGSYAARIVFSDGHDTGLFSWTYLARLGSNKDTIWARYLERLAVAGKSRD